MKHFFILSLILLSGLSVKAITLSDDAEISLITCAPGDMIYDCFGHTAIRVYDPAQKIDWVYNYGIYDFDVPNFELNFAKGYLKYKLGKGYFQKFIKVYTRDDRAITEQVLQLDSLEKQQFFGFMEWNALPENRYYFYDYFYDNCATRIRDVINKELNTDICTEVALEENPMTLRDLIHTYAHNNTWSALGIDMCMGIAIDQELSSCEYAFLPDYLQQTVAMAKVNDQALVKDERILYQGSPRISTPFIKGPTFWLWFVSLVLLILYGSLKGTKLVALDSILFGLMSFMGLFLLALWFLTDHEPTAWNLNVVWAQPLLLVAVFLKKKAKARFFQVWAALLILLLLNWLWLPQELNTAFIPLIALLGFRAYMTHKRLAKP